MAKTTVLFVCVHNAGRSQMAAGWLKHLGGDRVEVLSAGSAPAEHVNPAAVEAMREVGIDIAHEQPKLLRDSAVQEADVVITMGCGDNCPFHPGKRYEDWKLEDPAGQGIEAVRPIRDEIRVRVEELLQSLPAGQSESSQGCCGGGEEPTPAPAGCCGGGQESTPVAEATGCCGGGEPVKEESGCCGGRPPKSVRIDVFEPALCCNTGVCGPDPDDQLVGFTADLNYLREQGVDIERHNLANDPQAFAHNDVVRSFLQVAGSEGLPLVLVDGVTVATGRYPSREELARYAGVANDLGLTAKPAEAAAGCCGDQGGCC